MRPARRKDERSCRENEGEQLLTDVEEPPRELGIARRPLGEGRLAHELIGLVVQVVLEIVAQQQGQKGGLQIVIVAEGGGALRGEKGTA